MTDFKTWDRKTLEEFARHAADDNKALRADLKAAMLGWRLAVIDAQRGSGESLSQSSGPALAVLPGDLDQLQGRVPEGVSARG